MKADLLTKEDREQAICRAHMIGFAPVDIGRAFNLTGQRVRQIIKKHDLPPRSPCIPYLVWYDDPTIFEGLGTPPADHHGAQHG